MLLIWTQVGTFSLHSDCLEIIQMSQETRKCIQYYVHTSETRISLCIHAVLRNVTSPYELDVGKSELTYSLRTMKRKTEVALAHLRRCTTELQISGGIEDNSTMFFLISQVNISCDPH